MLDLGDMRCVLDVAELRSFSKAAERRGLAQSVISRRVRHVETLLDLPIFARTSRSVALTHQGRAFLPYAQAMLDAEAAARHAAKALCAEMSSRLMLGTYNYMIPQRQEVMDLFLGAVKQARIEVVYGSRAELLADVRAGRLDVAMIASLPGHHEPDFTSATICSMFGHLLVPADHALSAREAVEPADLKGMEIVYSPSDQDSLVRAAISARLAGCGASLLMAPEAQRDVMEHFAEIRHCPVLRWLPARSARAIVDGKVLLPFRQIELELEMAIFAAKSGKRPIAARFLEAGYRQAALIAAAHGTIETRNGPRPATESAVGWMPREDSNLN